jgi:hypothetical protein
MRCFGADRAKPGRIGLGMTMRVRKLIGTIALFVLIAVYSFVAMMVAIVLQVNASPWVEVVYYVVAGLAWVIPAGVIVWWMQKPDAAG